jgi:predicted phage terminase large subunit-like protein
LTLITANENGELGQPREAFYGGAAGGGKSEALLMAAAQYVHVPGYSALILRKTLPDLNQANALIPRSHEWWSGSGATWHEAKKRWTFPIGRKDEAVIRFGYLERQQDLDNYMGSEYQFIGFDEATQFPEHHYTYLFSRLRRRRGMDVPLRVRAGSNPGGRGHEWVKRRFIEEGEAAGRIFVPAKLSDNPSLDEEEYRLSLNELDPITRAQLLEGDWAISGQAGNLRREWFEVLDYPPDERHFERVIRYWDTAAVAPLPGQESRADYTVGTKMAKMGDTYIILDVVRMQGSPADVEQVVYNTALADGEDVEVFMEQEPGASGKYQIDHYVRLLQGFYFEGIRSTGPKPVRAAPFATQAKSGNIKIVRGAWNLTRWFDEVDAFPTGDHDDQVD